MVQKPLFSIFLPALVFGILACSPDSSIESPEIAPEVLIFGGGDHHDFERWFNIETSMILSEAGASVRYTDNPEDVIPALPDIDILNMNTNQAIDDPDMESALLDFVDSGNGLLLVHAATWYIWDWPDYYRELIGGGSRSHGPLGEFEVYVTDRDHPVMAGVPERFRITDELYRFERHEEGADMHVLAVGIEPDSGDEYPVAWTVEHGDGRLVNITLGHDGDAHQHEAFIAMLQNSVDWLSAD